MKFYKKLGIVAFALYVTFILLSMVPYMAESQIRTRQGSMDASYSYHLVFQEDGRQSHYDVTLVDPSKEGVIDITYTTASNTLDVTTTNIENLDIYCKDIYNDESENVFKLDPNDDDDYYKNYFIDQNLFTVKVETDHAITELRFRDAPEPGAVYVDGDEWWMAETIDYSFDGKDIVLTHVPKDRTTVEIYFKVLPPEAKFTIGEQNTITQENVIYGYINKDILFDGSGSNDADDEGIIEEYTWDFGDDLSDTGEKVTHKYSGLGVYTVTLTVTDDHGLKNEYTEKISIRRVNDLDLDGMDDDWEIDHGLDPTVDDSKDDLDDDDLNNFQEFENGTDPEEEDSDEDGYLDIEEIREGSNPNDPDDIPVEKGADGDDKEDNSLLYMMILGLVLIIIIVIILFVLIQKRKKKGEIEATSEAVPGLEPGAVGVAGEPQGQVQPQGQPQPFMYPTTTADVRAPEPAPTYAADEDVYDYGVEEPIEEKHVEYEPEPAPEFEVEAGVSEEPLYTEPEGEVEMEVEAQAPLPPSPLAMEVEELPVEEAVEMPVQKQEVEVPVTPPATQIITPVEAPPPESEPESKEEEPKMNIKYYVKKGALYFRKHHYSKAIMEWQRALELEPDHPEIVASINEALAKLKEKRTHKTKKIKTKMKRIKGPLLKVKK